jgi:hypothetical protein
MEKLIRQLPEVQQEVVRLTLYDDLKPCSSSSNGAQWELGAVGGIAPSFGTPRSGPIGKHWRRPNLVPGRIRRRSSSYGAEE